MNQSLWSLLTRTFSAWNTHEAPRWGAALAFYTILSLAPLVVLSITIAAFFFGRSTAQHQLLGQIGNMIGREGSDAVKEMIEQAKSPARGAFASLFGVITLLFGASGVFGELRSALNKIWDVDTQGEDGLLGIVKERFFSFGMVLAVGFLLLVSLVISTALAGLGKFFGGSLPLPEVALAAINFVISLIGITVLFALVFKFVPEMEIGWKSVWMGAVFTAFLFSIGKLLIGLYLGKAAVASSYGAAGSLMAVVIWVYYSAMIFLFGAEFTHVLDSPRDNDQPQLHTANP
jgi:membrane protein